MNAKGHLIVAVYAAAGLLSAACICADQAQAVDWLTHPSTFTHSPTTGQRVSQFTTVEAPPLTDQTPLITGGFTHYRSTIQYAQTADNYHRVNQWGAPVRPYGEWLYPFRPYSVPYGLWGPPFAGVNVGVGFPFGPINQPGWPAGGWQGGGGAHGWPPRGWPNQGWPYLGLPFHQYMQNPAGPGAAGNPAPQYDTPQLYGP